MTSGRKVELQPSGNCSCFPKCAGHRSSFLPLVSVRKSANPPSKVSCRCSLPARKYISCFVLYVSRLPVHPAHLLSLPVHNAFNPFQRSRSNIPAYSAIGVVAVLQAAGEHCTTACCTEELSDSLREDERSQFVQNGLSRLVVSRTEDNGETLSPRHTSARCTMAHITFQGQIVARKSGFVVGGTAKA